MIEYELNGMVSSSLMLIYILVYSKYLVFFYVSTTSVVALMYIGSSWERTKRPPEDPDVTKTVLTWIQ